jgi:gamma-glutamylputrescine oxidase
MNLSYWEIKSWLTEIDFAIIGSGIVGLSCAIRLRELHPKAKIVVFERGQFPQGASTKNAGFACFGSLSEILDDLNHHSEEDVVKLIKQRVQGLTRLRTLISDQDLGFKPWGGYELFPDNTSEAYDRCRNKMDYVNHLIADVLGGQTFHLKKNTFGYQGIREELIFNQYEGQIDTGKMMQNLLALAYKKGVMIINSASLKSFEQIGQKVHLQFNTFNAKSTRLLIATNGFSSSLIEEDVTPNRAQVLITTPIPNLAIRGTFHMDRGYYYFRNIDNRILLGGGRNLDIEKEKTTVFDLNLKIQDLLDRLLRNVILPNHKVKIEHRWTGILGLGKKKTSLIKQVSERVYCGVRLGGMGIAIGCDVGAQLAELTKKKGLPK